MELQERPRSSVRARRLLRWLLGGTFVDLGLLVLLAYLHLVSSVGELLFPIVFLGVALLFLLLGSVGSGVYYAWQAYPQHRRAILFVVAITLITLLAHAYIIGSPPASNSHVPVTGEIGTLLTSTDTGDSGTSLVTVTSSLVGDQLNVTLTASGSDAIVDPVLSVNSQLSGSGFAPAPTFASPLEPGGSVAGTWTVTGHPTNLSLGYQSLNCYKTSGPDEYGCIMDEIFYVPEGMGILQGQACTAGSGAPTDCHLEHPPLSPALIAAGMAVLGEYNSAGWRLMSVLLGTACIPLLFGIAWKISGSKKLAYISSLLLALDVMFFSQSSAALLDIPEIFFGLAAFFAYFVGVRFWKFDKYIIAGALLGLAGLAKETAVFIAFALLTYILIFDEGNRRLRFARVLKVLVVVILVFAAGLEAYDAALTYTPAFGGAGCQLTGANFLGQINYILCYGSGLIATHLSCITAGYWCKFPNDPTGTPILPTDWITFYSPVAYYKTSVTVCPNSVNGVCKSGAYSYISLAYYGVTNFLETWTIYVWIPLVAYALYRWFKREQPSLDQFGFHGEGSSLASLPGELKLGAFALILFLWSYIPYLFLFAVGRVTYPFYFLPAVPAVAVGASYWVTRNWFPRWLLVVYLVMTFLFFFIYFPEKGFLPDWLRVLIGH